MEDDTLGDKHNTKGSRNMSLQVGESSSLSHLPFSIYRKRLELDSTCLGFSIGQGTFLSPEPSIFDKSSFSSSNRGGHELAPRFLGVRAYLEEEE
ncbi:conserved hypothetical protein [Ricinus communis]|uniref:Uncharacterized protein n=1 Tax=Ricinus communis TaxID=3988 RepID=B9RPH0_RICCO|nr:conserved hypothetical protein [Ricinus communis]